MRDNDQYMLTDDERKKVEGLLNCGVYSKTYVPTDEELVRLNELYVRLGIPQELDAMLKELRRSREVSL